MTELEQELTHLLNLAASPYRECWIDYIRVKARGLAKYYPEIYLSLPSRLEAELSKTPK